MKKSLIVLSIIVIIGIVVVGIFGMNKKSYEVIPSSDKNSVDEITDDYIAVFKGGAGEITVSTYVYKIDNGKENYGFRYINTEDTTTSWGSSQWQSRITGNGKIGNLDEILKIANHNGAYSYVKLPNDTKVYSIEEFEKMFLKN